MKKIKNLDIKMTFSVWLSDIEIPDDVYKGLYISCDESGVIDPDNTYSDEQQPYIDAALEWLDEKITQTDAYKLEYEIKGMEE